LKRDFRLQVFLQISFPLAPEYFIGAILNFLQKFTEIFATLCLSPVSLTRGDSALFRTFMDSMTLAINLSPMTTTLAMTHPPVKTTPAKMYLTPVSLKNSCQTTFKHFIGELPVVL
jgi:hypothetical protein